MAERRNRAAKLTGPEAGSADGAELVEEPKSEPGLAESGSAGSDPAESELAGSGRDESGWGGSGWAGRGWAGRGWAGWSRRTRLIAAALAVLVLLGVGYAAGRLTPLFTAPGDDSPEAGFARDMSVHHAQAVHMSMVEYDRGENSSIRRLAYDIATSQQYQIGMMESWLRDWRLPLTTDRAPMSWMPEGRRLLQPDGRMPGLASADELKRLEAASGRDADILFCRLMLRHHLGGIHMADGVLSLSDDKRVRELASGMRNTQQGEVEALRLSLKSLGVEPA